MGRTLGRLVGLPWGRVLRATLREFLDDNGSFVASGVAFRVALAVFPGVALLVWVGTRLLGPEEAQALAKSLAGVVPAAAQSVLKGAVSSSTHDNPVDETGASLLGGYAPLAGLAFAVWSTNGGMWALFDAMNVIYDRTERRSTPRILGVTLLFTLVTLVLFALVTGLLVLVPALLPRAGLGWPLRVAADAARWSLSFAAIALSLSLLFRYAPNRERDAWPLVTVGSTLGALLLVLSSALYSWAVDSFADLPATYGSLSAVVSFLLWLWISFLIVLGAAELDSCIEVETGLYGRQGPPPPGADGR